jgi:hybrid cluster-associated redox disulfide protein
MTRPPITPNMRIRELIERYPQILPVLHQHGIRCGDCHASHYESLGQGAKVHNIDIAALLDDLNHAARRGGTADTVRVSPQR